MIGFVKVVFLIFLFYRDKDLFKILGDSNKEYWAFFVDFV